MLVCIKCREEWTGKGSPSACPECGEESCAINVEENG